MKRCTRFVFHFPSGRRRKFFRQLLLLLINLVPIYLLARDKQSHFFFVSVTCLASATAREFINVFKPIVLLIITLTSAFVFLLVSPKSAFRNFSRDTVTEPMARSFVLWLHGLGDSGPANEPIKTLFTSPQFRNTKWSFPSAPHAPVTCNCMYIVFC